MDRKIHASLDSTNAEAARIAPQMRGPTWVLAHVQTAARGRRGRAWVNPEGNFAASLVMRPEGPLSDWALRSFAAALALAEALDSLTGQPDRLTLKWPNDVLLDGGKLAGILLETAGPHLVIGIGVNLVHAPTASEVEARAMHPVSLLDRTGLRITPEELLTPLAACFARHEAQFAQFGFAPLRRAWLARAARIGQEITARMGPREVTGLFRDVDAQGNLVLETAAGVEAIPAAEIYFDQGTRV